MKSEGCDKEINGVTDRWFGKALDTKTGEWTEEKTASLIVGKTGVKIGKLIGKWIVEKIDDRTDAKIAEPTDNSRIKME